MKTERENSHKDTKALRKKRDNYLKTSCLRALVAKNGFTLPELLTAIAIIVILIGVLMPALAQVKKLAKETKQKAQLGSIDVGINLYKNDFGEYPPSSYFGEDSNPATFNINDDYTYCGAQMLSEAMFGQDLLGVNIYTEFRPDGKSKGDVNDFYPESPQAAVDGSLRNRKDPYLDRTNISVFTPRQIFDKDTSSNFLEPDRYVICDVFTAVSRKIKIGGMEKTYKVGAPVLYFRANPSAENTQLIPNVDPIELARNIYIWRDNYWLMFLKRISDGKEHPLCPKDTDMTKAQSGECFYGYIGDPMIPNLNRPFRPDSFILISAGSDGLYGTKDDICNFDPNLPS